MALNLFLPYTDSFSSSSLQFRQMRSYDVCEECPCDELNGLVINNYRPPLPVGNREIREAGGH